MVNIISKMRWMEVKFLYYCYNCNTTVVKLYSNHNKLNLPRVNFFLFCIFASFICKISVVFKIVFVVVL